jgi:hypothetical protein
MTEQSPVQQSGRHRCVDGSPGTNEVITGVCSRG